MAYPNPTILIVTLNVIDYIQLKGIDNQNRDERKGREEEERERGSLKYILSAWYTL